MKPSDSQGWGGGPPAGPWELGGSREERRKAKGRSPRGTGIPLEPPATLPIQASPSESGHEAQAPPPCKSVAPPTGPSGVGFWWKKGVSGGGERVRGAQQPGLSPGPTARLAERWGGCVAASCAQRARVHKLVAGPWTLGSRGWQRGHPSWPPRPAPLPVSPQVSCSYVGCGESFADHSTLHLGECGPELQTPAPAAPSSTASGLGGCV